MTSLSEQIKNIIDSFASTEPETYRKYSERLNQNSLLTRDENDRSHFCVYFLPYDPKTKRVFYIHHKKSGLWLSPGGHIDKGELLLDALNREISEELGVINFFPKLPNPFLITITLISNLAQPCKEHFDIWFLLETDASRLNVNPEEFHESKWLSIPEAKQTTTDKSNIQALDIINIAAC